MLWLAVLLPLVAGELVLSTAQTNIALTTADYFDAHYPSYAYADLDIVLITQVEPDCHPVLANTTLPTGNLLVVVDSTSAFLSKGGGNCHDFRRLADRTQAVVQGDITAMAFVYSDPSATGHTGGPRKHYMADGFALPDRAPLYVTVFMNYGESDKALAFIQSAREVVKASLTQDIGPWNRRLRSVGYQVVHWFVFSLGVLLLLVGLYRVGQLVQHQEFSLRRPLVVIYLVSLLLLVFTLVLGFCTPQSAIYYLFNTTAASGTTFLFVLCLVLWIQRLKACNVHTLAIKALPLLYIVLGILCFTYLVYMIPMMIPKKAFSATMELLFGLVQNLLTLSILTCSGVFMLAGVQFYLHRNHLPPFSKQHLKQLALLNGLAAGLFLITGLGLLFRIAQLNPDSVVPVLSYYQITYLRLMVRMAILVLLLPIGQSRQTVEKV